jgi:hypothetical protein
MWAIRAHLVDSRPAETAIRAEMVAISGGSEDADYLR